MVYLVSALLTALICGPMFGGHLLYRDAVAVPEFPLTAAAFGIDGSAPRAVPQDAVLALASRAIDGGWLVAGLTALAVFGAGVGFGRLAARLIPQAGRAGAVAAAVVGIWNPYVAERLLQGHWSLLLGYAALGPIVLAVIDLAQDGSWRRFAVLSGLFAIAGFTPTGSMLALVIAAVTAVAVRPGVRTTLLAAVCWAATASPWLVAAAVSDASGSSSGASAFALRAEPGLGSLGTALGLGGIWNADAVPGSRTTWWAAVATVLLLSVLVSPFAGRVVRAAGRGRIETIRTPHGRTTAALALLALATVLLVVLAATGPGITVMDALLAHVPGAGLLRDAQKYLALVVPFVAVAVAAAVGQLRRLVPGGLSAAAIALLIVAPLPDLAWGVGGQVRPVAIPADYQRVVEVIGDGDGSAVALWPSDTVRRLSWTDELSLSPLPRMIDAPVVVDPSLIVDGDRIDAPSGRTAEIVSVLHDGGDPARLAALGVGWVVTEESDPPGLLAAGSPTVFDGDHLTVFRIDGATAAPSPSTVSWTFAIIALCLWCAALVVGLVAAITASRRYRPISAG